MIYLFLDSMSSIPACFNGSLLGTSKREGWLSFSRTERSSWKPEGGREVKIAGKEWSGGTDRVKSYLIIQTFCKE